jgi:hypothetical protein
VRRLGGVGQLAGLLDELRAEECRVGKESMRVGGRDGRRRELELREARRESCFETREAARGGRVWGVKARLGVRAVAERGGGGGGGGDRKLERVAIAVHAHVDEAKRVARCGALVPELVARARVEDGAARVDGERDALARRVDEAERAAVRVDDDGREEAVGPIGA